MLPIKKSIILIFLLFLTVALFFYGQITRPNSFSEQTSFTVEKGSSVRGTITQLAEHNYISSPFAMRLYLKFRGWDSFIAGVHLVKQHATIVDIARLLTFGKAIDTERTIRIIEGWNKYEIADYLAANTPILREDFLAAVAIISDDLHSKYSFLDSVPENAGLEGFLYPDTYRIRKDATAEDVVVVMLNNMQKKITDEMASDIATSNYSFFQMVTLASIVEHEAADDEDRRMVADVFLKRIDLGMPLQSDATVNYVTGKSELQPLFKDTAIENPYNTYHNPGLPPGPISNPSITSIRAVLYPAANPYYYFLTTKEGNMVYSKTGVEHLENKRKYLDQ